MTKHAFHDIGACLDAVYCAAEVDVTAGGSGDATEVNGAWISVADRMSIKVLLPFTATLGAGETISFAANLQEASDISGTGAADFGDAVAATVVATGESGGSTEKGVVELDFDVSQTDGFVRVQFTPDMSRANTDTAKIQSAYVRGGASVNPITNALNA